MEGNKGIEPIGKEDRNLSGMDFSLLWAGAAVSLAEIWAGGLLVPLGFLTGFLVIIIGHVVGNDRFLQPDDVELGKGPGGTDRLVDAPAHVRIHHQREVVAQEGPHGADLCLIDP